MEGKGIERSLAFVRFLSDGKKHSLEELMIAFNTGERTIYRYLNAVENAGFRLVRKNGSYWLDSASSRKVKQIQRQGSSVDFFGEIFENKRIHLKAFLTEKAYQLLISEYPVALKYTTKTGISEYVLEGHVASYENITRFTLGLAGEVKVIDDEDFMAFALEKLKRFLG